MGLLEMFLPPKSSENLTKLPLSSILETISHDYEAWSCCSHLEDKASHEEGQTQGNFRETGKESLK